MQREAVISGRRTDADGGFEARLTIERRASGLYCKWTARGGDGEFLAMKAFPIAAQQIPTDVDAFEFALRFSTESMRRARMLRKRFLEPQTGTWLDT